MDELPEYKLDQSEKTLLAAFENGKLVASKDAELEKRKAKKAAINFLKKDKRINIRISSADLALIKCQAAEEGLPYQTFIVSVLHKLVSKKKIA